MRWLLVIAFFVYLYLELAVFIAVAGAIGLFTALLLIIAGSVAGISVIRRKGFNNLLILQQKIHQGENPAAEMIKSVSFIVAGILLLIPGFITDGLALLLLLPVLQNYLLIRLMPYIRFQRGSWQGRTFDGEYQRKEDRSRLGDPWDKP